MEGQFQLSTVRYQKDAYITIEGKPNADRFYIIQQGKVGISKEVVVAKEEGKVLSPGDFFGVISTMSGHSHIENAQALTDVVLVTVLKEQYGTLIQKSSQVAMKIIMQFSRQLRHLNETLAGITLKKTTEISPDYLFEVARYYSRQKQFSKALYSYTHYLKHCPEGENVDAAQQRIAELKAQVKEPIKEFGPGDVNRTYLKDSLFFIEGEPGDEMFIIQKGSVKITKVVGDNEVLLAVIVARHLKKIRRANFGGFFQGNPRKGLIQIPELPGKLHDYLHGHLVTLLDKRSVLFFKNRNQHNIGQGLGVFNMTMPRHGGNNAKKVSGAEYLALFLRHHYFFGDSHFSLLDDIKAVGILLTFNGNIRVFCITNRTQLELTFHARLPLPFPILCSLGIVVNCPACQKRKKGGDA